MKKGPRLFISAFIESKCRGRFGDLFDIWRMNNNILKIPMISRPEMFLKQEMSARLYRNKKFMRIFK